MEPSRSRGLVLKSEGLDVKVANFVDGCDFEAVDLVSNIDIVGHSVLASRDIFADLMSFSTGRH